jgi:hypothetical protein
MPARSSSMAAKPNARVGAIDGSARFDHIAGLHRLLMRSALRPAASSITAISARAPPCRWFAEIVRSQSVRACRHPFGATPERRSRPGDDVVDIGEVAAHAPAVEYFDRPSGQDRRLKISGAMSGRPQAP